MTWSITQGDATKFLRSLPEGSVDLCLFSPPYEEARLYLENGADLGVARKTEEWVAWMVEVFKAALHCTKGLVACVCEGQTRGFRYSGGPVLLWADLIRAGITTRKAPIYHRVGIPGSGGPDWWRNDYEFVICATRGGKLPWSDNTATGAPPKWAPGGEPSHRLPNGRRVHKPRLNTEQDGTQRLQGYNPPEIANPGNIIRCVVGGGRMGDGDAFASESEAPYPESLVLPFVLSFAPPGGLVCDPFTGSGTTGAVAIRHGRNFTGCDLRQSQVDLARRRLSSETPLSLLQE